jgi:stage II sporulation protein P
MFGLPDLKSMLKNSGEKAGRTIVSGTLIGYNRTIDYVINEGTESDSEDGKWQNKLIEFVQSTMTPIYKFMDNQYEVSLDKSDPSYKKNLIMFNGNQNNNTSETGTGGDSTQTASNITIPMPQVTGVQYSIEQLSDFNFLVSNFYTVSDSTVVYSSDLNAADLMTRDMTIKQDNSKPQILIYHTHSQEDFVDSVAGDPSTYIVGVGTYLAQILSSQFGYNVIHDTNTYDLVNGVLDRSKAYDYAGESVAQTLADNPSIEVILDIHRDGVNDDVHLVTQVNGKQTAKIMFFNGMSRLKDIGDIDYLKNPNREDNLAMSLQMKMLAMAYYPDFTRKNFIKAYEHNLNLRPKSMLIEVGAQTNTLQEEKNAMEPLAVLINKLLKGEK